MAAKKKASGGSTCTGHSLLAGVTRNTYNGHTTNLSAALTNGRIMAAPSQDGYEHVNAQLRDLHLARRGIHAPSTNFLQLSTDAPQQLQLAEQRPPARKTVMRTAAQRAAAERFAQPREAQMPPVQSPAPLIGTEDFYRRLQGNIKSSRMSYNNVVSSHYDSLKRPPGDRGRAQIAAPTDQIGVVAHERASRHVQGITEFVRGSR